MKRLRVFCLILLVCAAISVGYCKVKQFHGVDKTGPLIRMDETNLEISVKDEADILQKGVTALDTKDGDVTNSIVVESVSDFLTDGRRIVTLAAFDSDGHVGKAERLIKYKDYEHPRYKLKAAMNFPTGSDAFLESVSVTDVLDGDLTNAVKFSQGTEIMTDVPGNYKAKLEVTNSAGDTAYLPITITIYDSSSFSQTPQIGLKSYIKYVPKGKKLDLSEFLDTVTLYGTEYEIVPGAGMTADSIGKEKIMISDKEVDYDKPGVYEAEYTMKSEEGKLGRTRLIVVVEE